MKQIIIVIIVFWSQYLQAEPVNKVKVALFHTFSKSSSFCYDPYGQNLERGVRLAWDDFKKEHTKLLYDISFAKYDYDDSKLKAIEVVEDATRDGVSVGMGFICSDFAILGGERAQKNKLPLITPTASDDRIAQIGDYVKMGIYTNSIQGSMLARFAYKDMAKRRTLIISAADCTYSLSAYTDETKRCIVLKLTK